MHALALIDTVTQTADAIVPAKVNHRNDKETFGTVLSAKQKEATPQGKSREIEKQPETVRDTKKGQPVVAKPKTEQKPQVDVEEKVSHEEVAKNEGIAEPLESATGDVTANQGELEGKVEGDSQLQDQIQQLLADLSETLSLIEALEDVEGFGELEMVLGDLIEQLETVELSSSDFAGATEEQLATLVGKIEQQLVDNPSLLKNVEMLTVMLAETQQPNVTPVITENLQQVRQLLQQALVNVATQSGVVAEAVVVEQNSMAQQVADELLVSTEETAEEIDPRFAGLLKPRAEQRSAQVEVPSRRSVQLQDSDQIAGESTDLDLAVVSQGGESSQFAGGNTKQSLEGLIQQTPSNFHPQGQPPIQGLEMNRAMPQAPIVQLPSGQQVTENQIFDQVVTQISGSVNGESGRMVLRLQPAELGSLKLELMVEGDKIRANIHAQSQQVQEVLERNLPQLRNALAEQGLKIDQFLVTTDKNSEQQRQFDNLAQQQHGDSQQQRDWQQADADHEELNIPLTHLIQNGGGGISLHV